MKLFRVVFVLMMIAGLAFSPAKMVSAMDLSLTSCIQIQNLENVASSIELTFYPQTAGGTAIVVQDSILASSSKTICNVSSLPAGFMGSAVISSTTRLAVVANMQTPDYTGLMGSSRGADAGSSPISVPLVKKNDWGYSTQFTVQNVGSATTTVNVTYTDGVTASHSVEANRSYTFDQSLEAHVDPFPASSAGWVGAASISADQPLVVVNIESNNSVLLTYNGFTAADASTNPIFPMIQANWYTYFTGLAIQNTTATNTNVTVSYTPTIAGTACTQTLPINGNQMTVFAVSAWASTDTNANNNCVNGEAFVGYARVSANSANVPLVGIGNLLSTVAIKGGSYTGFNPSAGTTTVLFPLITDHNYGFFTGFGLVNVGDTAVDITCSYSNTTITQSTTNLAVNAAWSPQQLNLFFASFPSGYVGSGTCVATKTAGTGGGMSVKILGTLNYLKNGTTKDTLLVSEGINN